VLHTAVDMGSNDDEEEQIEESDLIAQIEVPPEN